MKKSKSAEKLIFYFFLDLGTENWVSRTQLITTTCPLKALSYFFIYVIFIYSFFFSLSPTPKHNSYQHVCSVSLWSKLGWFACVHSFHFHKLCRTVTRVARFSKYLDHTLKKYLLFNRNSNLTGHPVFYLATLAMDLFRRIHIAGCMPNPSRGCREFSGDHQLQFTYPLSPAMDPSVVSSSLVPQTTLWYSSVSTVTALVGLQV